MPQATGAWDRQYIGKAKMREGLAARFKGVPDVRREACIY